MKRLPILFVLMFLATRIWASQDSITYPYPHLNGRFIKSCFTDGIDLVKSPLHWNGQQLAAFGATVATGAILYTQDQHIRDFWQHNQSNSATNLSKYVFEPWGSGKYTVPLVGGLFIAGLLYKDERLSATALTAGKAALLSGILIEFTKEVTQRQRPYEGTPADHTQWRGPFAGSGYTSFPSGHTGFAFSVAAVLASEYKETVWVPIVCYTIACGTGLSRLYDDKHWSSDVFTSAVAGYVIGKFLWKQNRKLHSRIAFFPSAGANGYGLDLSIKVGKP